MRISSWLVGLALVISPLATAIAQPCTVPNTFASGTTASAAQVNANFSAVLNCIAGFRGNSPAQGRLTLASGMPVMNSGQLGKTTIYYTPYLGNQIQITTNGTSFSTLTFAELSNATTASATGNAGPAAVTANKNYDLFVWSNSGSPVLTRGPAWTSDTARGTGAGTSELQQIAGIWTNKVAISNGPAANRGTYVGTVRSNGASQIDWNPTPNPAVGGGNAVLGVFNAYNRVGVSSSSYDSTATWSTSGVAWRAMNNSNANRISYVDGLGEIAAYSSLALFSSSSTVHASGINRNSTTATPPFMSAVWNVSATATVSGTFQPLLGFHYLQAVEADSGGAGTTQYGTGAPGGWAPAGGLQLNSFTAAMEL